MSVVPEETSPAVFLHPEEIKSIFDLRVGKHITLQGTARITPAGVISAGISVAAMTLALGYLVGSITRRRDVADT
jgi:hypothetical protein